MSELRTTAQDSEARLVKHDGDPYVAGFVLIRRWEKIHASSADTIFLSKNAVTARDSFRADRQWYDGPFVVTSTWSDVDEEDAVDIYEKLTKVKSITSDTMLGKRTPERLQKNEIYDLFTVAHGEGDMYALKYKNLNPASRVFCMAIADTACVAKLADCSSRAWQYHTRTFDVQEDRTATFIVVFKKDTWNNASSDTAAVVTQRQASFGNQRSGITRTWFRRSTAARDTLMGYNGNAVTNQAYLGTTYTHVEVGCTEAAGGAWTVQQHLEVPRSRVTVNDKEDETPVDIYERVVPFKASDTSVPAYTPRVFVDLRTIFNSAQSAVDYAELSDCVWTSDDEGTQKYSLGRVKYLGENKYEGHKVKHFATAEPPGRWANIDETV